MFEYAASFPSEAEESLKAEKQRYKSLLGIIASHGKELKPLINQISIESTPCRDGYEYEIIVPHELATIAKTKAETLLSSFDCVDLDWFTSLAETDFERSFDHENETCYNFPPNTPSNKMLSPQLNAKTGELVGLSMYGETAKAFNCFLRVNSFL